MKKYLILVLFLFVSSTCFAQSSRLTYFTIMDSVQINETTIICDTETAIKTNSALLVHNDSIVQIAFFLTDNFVLILENKTNYPITIDWNKVAFINFNKQAMSVLHSGIKYTDKGREQPLIVVPPKSNIYDEFIPKDNISYIQSSGSTGFDMVTGRNPGWQIKSIIPRKFKKKEQRDLAIDTFIGKSFSIYFPIINHKGEVIHYTLNYTIYQVIVESGKSKKQVFVTSSSELYEK